MFPRDLTLRTALLLVCKHTAKRHVKQKGSNQKFNSLTKYIVFRHSFWCNCRKVNYIFPIVELCISILTFIYKRQKNTKVGLKINILIHIEHMQNFLSKIFVLNLLSLICYKGNVQYSLVTGLFYLGSVRFDFRIVYCYLNE